MRIIVGGFGHFAGVVAYCLAAKGYQVSQIDKDPYVIRKGQKLAESEPGWQPWVEADSLESPDIVWIAYDVPLDESGAPVVTEVLERLTWWDERVDRSVPFLISCQWPVGTLGRCALWAKNRPIAYVMENVRVGQAISDFQHQPCVVLGCDLPDVPPMALSLLSDLSPELLLLSSASAEMAKHATNVFMALQIAFINEIADLSRQVGASPASVAAVLLKDFRVRPNAPLIPGKPFGGGSLKRDLKVLERIHAFTPIIDAILPSNEARE